MLNRLHISLLGTLQITFTGKNITTDFGADTARALLIYLAMHSGTIISREVLANLLWPEKPEKRALGNLRQTLNRIRIALDDRTSTAPFLLIQENKDIQFNAHSYYQTDAAQFLSLVETTTTHRHRRLEGCPICMERLVEAIELYQGEFLDGFTVASEPFQEWLRQERERLHIEIMDALYSVTNYYERLGSYRQAQKYAYQQLELEPWNEEAYQQLMRLLAADGQRSAALRQYRRCCDVLKRELDAPPTEETVALYEAIRRNDLTQIRLKVNSPAKIPQITTPFIGRKAEVAQVIERLLDPRYRLVTIVGAGGAGKTRLSLAAAEKVSASFDDGIVFVPLADIGEDWLGVTDAHRSSSQEQAGSVETGPNSSHHLHNKMATSIAQAIGLSFQEGGHVKEQLLMHLRHKEMLLILDSFEYLIRTADFVHELMQKSPKIVLLVTSRQPLNFAIESVVRLQGLAVPPPLQLSEEPREQPAQAISKEPLLTYDSVQMFVERVEQRGMGHILNETAWPTVGEICRCVAGMPLGIQLVAVQVGQVPLSKIVQQISEGIHQLETTMPDIPERHRNMEVVLQHSWQTLSALEADVFAKLSIFRKSFTQEAVLHIVTQATPAILTVLVDKSLLWWTANERYEIHELVRQFASAKFAMKREAAVIQQHSDYYLNFVAQRETALKQGESSEPLTELQAELGNIRQAWQSAVSHTQWALVSKSLKGLWRFYQALSLPQEGEGIFDYAIQHFQQENDLSSDQKEILSSLCTHRSFLLEQMAQFDLSLEVAQKAISWAQTDERRVKSHLWQGVVLARLGAFETAIESLTYALETAKQIDDEESYARALHTRGIVRMQRGEYEIAMQDYEQLLPMAQQIGDKRGELSTLYNLGLILYQQHNLFAGQTHFQRALLMAQVLSDQWYICHLYYHIGVIFFQLGNYQQARNRYDQAILIANKIHAHQVVGAISTHQSLLFQHLGDYQKAKKLSEKGLEIGLACNDPFLQSDAWVQLGHSHTFLEEWVEATTAYEQSLAIRQKVKQPHFAIDALAGLARVSLIQNDPKQALHYVSEILIYLERTPSFHSVEEPVWALLTCYKVLYANQDADAQHLLQTTYHLLGEWSDQIEDIDMRQRFLEEIPAHREIIDLWKKERKC